jgi:hypothetical protein
MALAYTVRLSTTDVSPSDPNVFSTISSGGSVGDLVFIQIVSAADSTPPTVSGITSAAFTEATFLYRSSTFDAAEDPWISRADWWVARSTAAGGTVTVDLSGTPDWYIAFAAISLEGSAGMSIIQSNYVAATSSTATVALPSSVRAGSECLYMASWADPADSATPGTGWTEVTGGDVSRTAARFYAQYHPSPSGAQSGAVSALTSQANRAVIFEIGADGFVGWGSAI